MLVHACFDLNAIDRKGDTLQLRSGDPALCNVTASDIILHEVQYQDLLIRLNYRLMVW